MEIQKGDKRFWIMVLSICLLTACGCTGSNAPPPNPLSQPQQAPAGPGPAYGPPAPPYVSPAPVPPAAPPRAGYFEFQDIPIPPEIKVEPKNSNIFESGQIKMGFLTLRGRVDSNSVANFFVAALPREGWRLKGQFRYSRSLLIFDKPDKICIIITKEGTYYTHVEIYVSPVSGG